MFMNQRTSVVYSLLADYVRSPSLRHMREQRSLAKLALEIVTKLDQDSSVWRKWEGPRDKVLASAIDCWIPKDDMLAFLNGLPGPALTITDLEILLLPQERPGLPAQAQQRQEPDPLSGAGGR